MKQKMQIKDTKLPELTQENLRKIAYLQLKSLKEEKGRVEDRIRQLEASLYVGCDEAFGALGELLRDNFNSLSHYDRMDILKILKTSKTLGCIESLIDILDNFESMEPKSRYLYEQMGKIIEVLGKSKKKWLAVILTKYKNSSSKLIREAAKTAILRISDTGEINRQSIWFVEK